MAGIAGRKDLPEAEEREITVGKLGQDDSQLSEWHDSEGRSS